MEKVRLHSEVFSALREEPFTVRETAEYLEVAEITVRRFVKDGTLKARRIGRNMVFDTDDLRTFKKRRAVR